MKRLTCCSRRIDEVDCDIDDKNQATCTLIQQSGTAEPNKITAKPAPIKMKAKFRATVYDQLPDKLADASSKAEESASDAAESLKSKYGVFTAGDE